MTAAAEPDERAGARRPGGDGLARAARIAGRLLVLALAIAAALWVLSQILVVVVPIILAVCAATVLGPPVRWLRRRGWKPALATAVVFLGAVLVFGGILAAVGPTTVNGITDLAGSVDAVVEDLQELAANAGIDAGQIEDLVARAQEELSSGGGGFASALSGVRVVGEVITGLLLAFVLTIYFVHDGAGIARGTISLLPAGWRERAWHTAEVIWSVLSGFIRGTAVIGVVNAFFLGTALLILDVPLVVPLAVVTFFGAFLPLIGAFIAGLLAAIVALVDEGWVVALIVVAVTVVVQQIEGDVIAPRIFSSVLRLRAVTVLLAIALGATVAGILGAFLAVPVAAVLGALIRDAQPSTPQPDS